MDETLIFNCVRQAQAGDRLAFDALVRQYESSVFAVVLRRVRNNAEAAEVTQEVFLRALRKLPQLREPERFVGWLKRIAIRLSINRCVRRPKESLQSPEMFDGYRICTKPPEERLVHAEEATEVRTGLAQLRPLDRDTLTAFYFEGQSLKEMSQRFDSPVGTIKRRLHTARARLKEVLVDFQPA